MPKATVEKDGSICFENKNIRTGNFLWMHLVCDMMPLQIAMNLPLGLRPLVPDFGHYRTSDFLTELVHSARRNNQQQNSLNLVIQRINYGK